MGVNGCNLGRTRTSPVRSFSSVVFPAPLGTHQGYPRVQVDAELQVLVYVRLEKMAKSVLMCGANWLPEQRRSPLN